MILRLSIAITSFSLLCFLALSEDAPKDFNYWCNQTPYSDHCDYSISHLPPPLKQPKQKPDFFKLAIRVALDDALRAERDIKWLGNKFYSKEEKVAWADCLALYGESIHQLKRIIDPLQSIAKADRQIWLSTALNNLETCRMGFVKLGINKYMPPIMPNNVSKLISNAFAINKLAPIEKEYKNGLPYQVRPNDWTMLQTPFKKPNLVVAKDVSGNFKTIQEAINAASKRAGNGRFVIHVKAGIYDEIVRVPISTQNIVLVGDDMTNTIITGHRSNGDHYNIYDSPTFAVDGDGFIACNITFRNTASTDKEQAVALQSSSNLSVFYRCSIEGNQDTLFVNKNKQFYRECFIHGNIDFIFGDAAAVFQDCTIYVTLNKNTEQNIITAQGRAARDYETGIVIHNSNVLAADDLKPVLSRYKTYLGRPWQNCSRVVYMKCYLDELIDPAGWTKFNVWAPVPATIYYGEYMNKGPGSSTANRVKWRGYHVITHNSEANKFTVRNFIGGDTWLPSTGVPFTLDL